MTRVGLGPLVLTALITATLVSVTGAIGFVGPVLPHAARFLCGPRHAGVRARVDAGPDHPVG